MNTVKKTKIDLNRTELQKRVIVALDTADLIFAKKLVHRLKDSIQMFKVGSELFTAHGPKAVEMVKKAGRDVFLDLKFHDIPNTVSQATRSAVRLGVSMLNVHIGGGLQMMQEACIACADEARKVGSKPPQLIGVTLLTSLDENVIQNEIGITGPMEGTILRYVELAQKAGLDGVVASALEVEKIRTVSGPDFVVVTPGIRPEWASRDDQVRVLTPQEAFALGASYIVVGRPITEAEDPKEAALRIFESL
ncbi:MAG: orotidine 5'-phosphate decarboxylase [Omnitrophica bacterium RIFCSPHIGHO2_02_FULL_49_9]|nr:MAG: orotidine 5'-phosphate decarboxylase [Omnitrophica bacterium RIFCSPHIGHO2_02_FULL_49_9]OGW89483.1 MAG: orotidine 5'-phosphate decarboxylase [Omnitrophica bacterium RIFCSPLOWO2_01_FULL_50_24]